LEITKDKGILKMAKKERTLFANLLAKLEYVLKFLSVGKYA
jgi:hypothetical protein